MSKEKQRQLDEINRPMNEQLFNNLEKQYQELAKVKSESDQIEEMAKATMKHCKIDNQCGSCHWSTCNECLAEILYNAGYRKQSDVARVIFEDLESQIVERNGLYNFPIITHEFIAEVKKKYMEDQT